VGLDLAPVHTELEHLRKAAAEFETRIASTKSSGKEVNAALIRTERALLDPDGLTGRAWYKHQLVAPGRYTGYSAKTLPSVRDSDDAAAGVKPLAEALRRYAASVEGVSKLLVP
jgi:N-acetylated-alpha-linked acidic dipeptidase